MSDRASSPYGSLLQRPLQLLRIAAYLACIVSGLLNFAIELYAPEADRLNGFLESGLSGVLPLWVISLLELLGYLLYGWAFWRITGADEIRSPGRSTWALLILQIALTGLLFSFDLFYVVTAEVGLLFSLRIGILCAIGQAAAETYFYFAHPQQLSWLYPTSVLDLPRIEGIAIVGFSSILFYFTASALGGLGASEERHRQQLAAMYQMEAERARVADRLAMARDLHDAMGHHLTALSVHLQLANRQATGPGQASVSEAYEVAQKLLHEVRCVVGDLREADTLELAAALESMVANVSSPEIHLQVDPEFRQLGTAVSHALFRCAQETITNAIRHSGARNLWIRLQCVANGYELRVRDDGHGAATIRCGNGLTGIRERLEILGGEVRISSEQGRGFDVRMTVPRTDAALA